MPESPKDAYFEIVGIVADAKNSGPQEAPHPESFMPYSVTGMFERGVLVRTAVDPLSLLFSVRREIWATDRGVALTFTGTLEGYLQQFSSHVLGHQCRVVGIYGAVFPVVWRLFRYFPKIFVFVEKIADVPPFNRFSHRIYYKVQRMSS